MLGAGDDPLGVAETLALEAAHLGGGRGGAEAGVLPRSLDDPAPARVAGDVHHGGEGPRQADGAGLARGDALRLLGDGGVPGRGHGDGHGHDGAQAVDDVIAEDEGDAVGALLDGDALERVDGIGVAHEEQAAGPPGAHLALDHLGLGEDLPVLLGKAVGGGAGLGGRAREQRGEHGAPIEVLGELAGLLLQAQAGQQVLDALVDGRGRVEVEGAGGGGGLVGHSGLGGHGGPPRAGRRRRRGPALRGRRPCDPSGVGARRWRDQGERVPAPPP